MEKKKLSKKYRIPIIIAIAVACIFSVLATVFTYAAFTSSLHAQRTIAAYDTMGERFSSNNLVKGDSDRNVRTIYAIGDNAAASMAVTVCNYPQGRQTLPADDNITYQISANLVYYDETNPGYVSATAGYISNNSLTAYTVTIRAGNNTLTLGGSTVSGTLPESTLTGGAEAEDVYSVVFSANFPANKPNLYLEMIATPSTQGYSVLRGIFKPELRAAGASDHWTGEFRDDTAGLTPADYDGYNYLVSGMGSGTVTLTWDTTKIEISDVSLKMMLEVTGVQHTSATPTDTTETLTFPVDSDVESRYDIQFYKVNIPAGTTWADMAGTNSGYVQFAFG